LKQRIPFAFNLAVHFFCPPPLLSQEVPPWSISVSLV
jgi:hypothetical protein